MGPKPRHTPFDKIKMCFEWPNLFKCLKLFSLWILYVAYFLYSASNLSYWFLSTPIACFPEILLFDILQWIYFFLCLLLCLASKNMTNFLFVLLWNFKVFLCILVDPNKVFSRSPFEPCVQQIFG